MVKTQHINENVKNISLQKILALSTKKKKPKNMNFQSQTSWNIKFINTKEKSMTMKLKNVKRRFTYLKQTRM
jgi:hypothetical protein